MIDLEAFLTRVIAWSLAHRAAVIAATLVVAGAGATAAARLPLDAFPDTTPVQVQVNTVADALSPEEIERQLTIPIEQTLSGMPRVAEVRSLSKFGLSQVTIRFDDDVDLWLARQLVSERIAHARLPPDVARPTLGPVATGLGEVFHYIVRGKGKTAEELRTIHDWQIAPQLRAVRGVAEVNAWGGAEKQWHVVIEPLRLQKFELSLADVYQALEKNNANVGGGVVERSGGASLVLGVGALTSGRDLRDVVVAARAGVPIRVGDIARVEVGRDVRRGAVTADGEGEVVLGLAFMLVGENSHDVTHALAVRLDEIGPTLPHDVEVAVAYERTTLVHHVLQTVRLNLLEGALLVIAVLLMFLGNVRAGIVVALVIPLSLLTAFNGMVAFGIAGTLMSLGAIDFGLIVDSSVIMVENAQRKLGLSAANERVVDVVRDAAVEVRAPTLFGELIIMIVYVPILALEGVEGKLFRPMAVTVLMALAASMVMSMTLMPVLASFALRHRRLDGIAGHAAPGPVPGGSEPVQKQANEPRLVRALQRAYAPVLRASLARSRVVVAAAVVVVVAGVLAATRLGTEFVPRLSEGSIVINTVRLAEVSLEESVRYGTRIENVLLSAFPDEIDRVWSRTGTAEIATDPMGIELTDVFVQLTARDRWRRAHTQEQLVAAMQEELGDMPGMNMAFTQPIEMRVNEMLAGVRGDVAIKVFGDDLEILKAKAREIELALRKVAGAADISVEQITGQPVTRVVVDRAAVARHGIAASDVLDYVAALGTREVGELREGERRFPIAVTLPARYQADPEAFASLLVRTPAGDRVPLGRLVHISEEAGPTSIQREWGKRRVVVQANVRGRDLGGFVDDVRSAVNAVEMPDGYYVRYGGQFENLERARLRLAIVVPVALALIFALLYATYRSVRDAARVFTGVPFALVGGVAALLVRDLPFSISAAVGFIALSGVSVLGDMVLVSRIRQLLDAGTDRAQAIHDAATSRVRPVLMTSTVAALGFLPMALSTGPGSEVQRPLATVVIGGVVSSTLLTLVVLPALYSLVGRARQRGGEMTATVIFACVHNAGRSQMAAAFFNALADPAKARAISAGTQPRERVHPEVVVALGERGIDVASVKPQKLTDELARDAQLLITMGCGDACPVVPGLVREDWPLEDPKGKPVERVREIRDDVEGRVRALITREGWARAPLDL